MNFIENEAAHEGQDAPYFYYRFNKSRFLEKSGLKGRMPAIVAGGSRVDAYKRFVGQLKKMMN